MFIVVYRPHNTLHCETKYFGPFQSHDDAYDYLCKLPAIGAHFPPENGCGNSGVKTIESLTKI